MLSDAQVHGLRPSVTPSSPTDLRAPIAVDLDGTLVSVDTLHEGVVQLLTRRPWMIFALLFALLGGKAKLKSFVQEHAPADVSVLPIRADLLDYLTRQHEAGRRIGLFSAAHQSIVDGCRERFQIFDTAVGTTATNLSGSAKLEAIKAHLGDDFVYAGDAPVDMPIWRESKAAIYVGRSRALRSKVSRMTTMEYEVSHSPSPLKNWALAMRVHQWPKNLLVFVPFGLSLPMLGPRDLLNALLAFAAMCTIASATYLINDLADISADRRHPSKKLRPFASGAISVRAGVIAVVCLGALAIGMASLTPLECALMLGLYALTSLAYSFRLKRVPMLDVLCLGFLFSVRLAVGASMLENSTPYWLYAFSMFFFTSLAFVKRHRELAVAIGEGKQSIAGRSYLVEDLPLILAAGIGTALASIVVFLIYLGDQQFDQNLFRQPEWLGLVVAVLAYWLLRTWLLTIRGQMHDDPVVYALKDGTSYVLGAVVGLALLLAW